VSSTTLSKSSFVRPDLGEFSSIVCFKAVVVGVENALGEKAAAIALVSAGRDRGKQLVADLGMGQKTVSEACPLLKEALGVNGTKLCAIDSVVEDGDTIRVSCRETICSAGEEQGSARVLTYTMGALQGAMEQLTGKRLRGKQVESVLRGSTHDVVEFQVL
jgi:predicted hydrocarbon binding protein